MTIIQIFVINYNSEIIEKRKLAYTDGSYAVVCISYCLVDVYFDVDEILWKIDIR